VQFFAIGGGAFASVAPVTTRLPNYTQIRIER